jgi:hypothetical protein
MKTKCDRAAGLSAAAVFSVLTFSVLLALSLDASAQDAKKTPPPKASSTSSPCKGLDEKACKGKAAECAWIVPSKGKQRPYCRLKPASRKTT